MTPYGTTLSGKDHRNWATWVARVFAPALARPRTLDPRASRTISCATWASSTAKIQHSPRR